MSLRRKRLPTTLRFEVLKRDGFRCQYCGAEKGDSELTVDHITSLDQGGSNDSSNLTTACEACNRGKSDTPLSEAKISTVYGPTWDKSQKRWLLRWKADGESRSFANADRATVAAKRAELKGEAPPVELPPLKHFASATDIRKGLEQAALALNRAAVNGNGEGVLLLRKYAAGLSEIGGAIVPHSGYVELEEDHAELLDFVEALHSGRELDDAEKPAAVARPAATLKSRKRPGKKPSRSRDPLPN